MNGHNDHLMKTDIRIPRTLDTNHVPSRSPLIVTFTKEISRQRTRSAKFYPITVRVELKCSPL